MKSGVPENRDEAQTRWSLWCSKSISKHLLNIFYKGILRSLWKTELKYVYFGAETYMKDLQKDHVKWVSWINCMDLNFFFCPKNKHVLNSIFHAPFEVLSYVQNITLNVILNFYHICVWNPDNWGGKREILPKISGYYPPPQLIIPSQGFNRLTQREKTFLKSFIHLFIVSINMEKWCYM